MIRFTKLMGAGLTALALIVAPQMATAGQIEAIWQINLWDQELDWTSGTYGPLTVTPNFHARTVFSDQITGTEVFEPHVLYTKFGKSGESIFEHDLMRYLPPNLSEFPYVDGPSTTARTEDYSTNYNETFNIGLVSADSNGERAWGFSSAISVYQINGPRNGDGSSNFVFTYEYLEDFLLEFQRNPESFYGIFSVSFYEYDYNVGSYTAGKLWDGDVRLISLRHLDALDIPEPSTIVLLGIGLVGTTALSRKKGKK